MENVANHKQFNGDVIVKKSFLMNPNLSLKAKGAMAMILLMKDVPDITETDLTLFVTDGLHGVRSAIKELEQNGYLKRERLRNNDGQFKGTRWTIIENSEQ